jgi:hypothetical protein
MLYRSKSSVPSTSHKSAGASGNEKTEITRWLDTESSYRCDNLAYEREGRARFLGLLVLSIAAQGRQEPGPIVTRADIAEGRRFEEQLRRRQKLDGIGQPAAGNAHEINTATQYVGNNTGFLKDRWGLIAELLNFCGTMRSECTDGPR